MIRLTIPIRLPSLNVTMNWHWSRRMKKKKEYFYYIRQSYNAPLPFERRKIKRIVNVAIRVYHPFRRFDVDNLHGAVKPIIDALKESGFIYNDSPKWIKKELYQYIDRANPRIEIEIEEV